jgi:hypothetical protein
MGFLAPQGRGLHPLWVRVPTTPSIGPDLAFAENFIPAGHSRYTAMSASADLVAGNHHGRMLSRAAATGLPRHDEHLRHAPAAADEQSGQRLRDPRAATPKSECCNDNSVERECGSRQLTVRLPKMSIFQVRWPVWALTRTDEVSASARPVAAARPIILPVLIASHESGRSRHHRKQDLTSGDEVFGKHTATRARRRHTAASSTRKERHRTTRSSA